MKRPSIDLLCSACTGRRIVARADLVKRGELLVTIYELEPQAELGAQPIAFPYAYLVDVARCVEPFVLGKCLHCREVATATADELHRLTISSRPGKPITAPAGWYWPQRDIGTMLRTLPGQRTPTQTEWLELIGPSPRWNNADKRFHRQITHMHGPLDS